VPLVGAVLDLAANALPVRLERVVPLQNHLKAEAQSRIADLFLTKDINPTVHVFSRDGGLDSFDAHEILVVERPQTVDRDLHVTD
jgi:hypothetical protein